jgi:hypothetical protein
LTSARQLTSAAVKNGIRLVKLCHAVDVASQFSGYQQPRQIQRVAGRFAAGLIIHANVPLLR